jgi:hypothetical protein
MKKLATFVFAMLLTGSLAFAQAAPAPSPAAEGTTKTTKTSKTKKAKKAKKSKKGSSSAETTANPK